MRVDSVRTLAAVAANRSVALTSFASASITEHGGSLSYSVPHAANHRHTAVNNLTGGQRLACAGTLCGRDLPDHPRGPKHGHARSKAVGTHGNTVGEEIFTRRKPRVAG